MDATQAEQQANVPLHLGLQLGTGCKARTSTLCTNTTASIGATSVACSLPALAPP